MQHLSMVKRLAYDRIPPPVANLNFLRPPDQQIQGESHWAETAHFTDLGQVATLEGHHHKNVGIRIPARLTTGQGTEQNHPFRCVVLHQLLRKGQQGLAGHQRGRRGSHRLIIAKLRRTGHDPLGTLQQEPGWWAAGESSDPAEDQQRQGWSRISGPAGRERRQWRPLDQALDVLWQVGAWREELIQLLEMLAERADQRPRAWGNLCGGLRGSIIRQTPSD